jgi:hypothetical protein
LFVSQKRGTGYIKFYSNFYHHMRECLLVNILEGGSLCFAQHKKNHLGLKKLARFSGLILNFSNLTLYLYQV